MATRMTFEEATKQYTNYVYNIALRVLRHPQDAEDAAQDALLQAYRNWERFRWDAEVTTWLYRIAVNAALMKLRKKKPEQQLTLIICDEHELADRARDPDLNPEEAVLNIELRAAVEEGLKLLCPAHQAAVILRDVQGLENIEAAEVIGITISAFKARLHHGRVRLRQHLESYVRAEQGTPRNA